uniref:Microtubule-associated protein 1B n=1 Tax=Bursaphelenchus xylophilus TaxID=6326 RepID=A0A1I7SE44_BURXY
AENRPENKLFESKSLLKPVELQKPKDEAKCKSEEPSGSKVGNLLKQLQKNQTSDAPMMMAVSSFVPVKVEPAKVLKIEEEKGEIKKDPAKVLSPELVSKTVSEKKVSVRKKKVHKTKEAGEPNKTEVESIKVG